MFEDILCVIPARGGSKGIRNKNKRPVSGVPLCIYSIRSAIESGIPHDHIVLSTDDEDIAGYGRAWGVRVEKRPEELSGDLSPTEDTMIDVLNKHPDKHYIRHVLLLQPTSPIRLKDRIKDCLMKYLASNNDSLLTVTKFPEMFWKKTSSDWVPTYKSRKMKQQLNSDEFLYFDNGNLYITNAEVLVNTKNRIGKNPFIYPVTYLEGIQIDNMIELSCVDGILKSYCFLRKTEEDLSYDKEV